MSSGRILGKKVDIDYDDVSSFFEKRAAASKGNALSTTMYGSEENALKRDAKEHQVLHRVLGEGGYHSVLDLGCGLGRLARFFIDQNIRYVGVDNSMKLIEIGRERYAGSTLVEFHHLPAYEVCALKSTSDKFDIAVVTGILMYLNDSDCKRALLGLSEVLNERSTIYMREPVSILNERLTLKNFFSEDLGLPYSSIYRTTEEYTEMYSGTVAEFGFKLIEVGFAYDDSLHSRSETKHKFFIYKRGHL